MSSSYECKIWCDILMFKYVPEENSLISWLRFSWYLGVFCTSVPHQHTLKITIIIISAVTFSLLTFTARILFFSRQSGILRSTSFPPTIKLLRSVSYQEFPCGLSWYQLDIMTLSYKVIIKQSLPDQVRASLHLNSLQERHSVSPHCWSTRGLRSRNVRMYNKTVIL